MDKKQSTPKYKDVFLELERNKNLFFNTPHTVFYKFNNSSLKSSYFSPSIEELTGYSKKELKELGFNKAIGSDVASELEHVNKNSVKTKEYYSRYWIETKGGEWKLVENFAYPDPDQNNKGEMVSGFIRDLTKLNNFITELQFENNKLKAIIDMAEVIILVLDTNGNVQMINKKACQLLGYRCEELIGKNWFDYLVPGRIKDELLNLANSIVFGEEKDYEYHENPVLCKNREEKIIAWHNKAYRNEDGKILFMLSSGEDITDKKNDEKIQQVISSILQASNSESDINEFFSYIHNSIKKLMTAENFYISLYDKNTEMITFPYFVDKYDPDQPPKKFGKGLTEYVLRKGESALVDAKMDKQLVEQGETEMIGTPTSIWLGIPLKISDFTIGALVVQDYENPGTYTEKEQNILEVIAYSISRAIERKRLEEERRGLIKKLEKLNTSKDKLFSLISHDLRSPFNSLLGFSEILTTEYETLTPDEIKEYIRAIYDSSKNLFGITNNLLQFSRFQMGKIEFKPEVLNLKRIINATLNLLKGNAVKKQLSIEVDMNENINVFADEDMLSSILQNLLSNAIKFTQKRGDIKIIAKEILEYEGREFLRVEVKDSGVGIGDSEIKKIFEGDLYTTPGTEKEFGTGLGLQLVKDFIDKNGGKFNLKSKINEGSTFSFTVPVKK
ncbi:MAG TPA: PAS domain S-box protein [Ignavibacteriaceae bacterium]|nr:PAS domain S-box protein [Ignavibacteriaceae bacterium]